VRDVAHLRIEASGRGDRVQFFCQICQFQFVLATLPRGESPLDIDVFG
jgi:hypothetical protein